MRNDFSICPKLFYSFRQKIIITDTFFCQKPFLCVSILPYMLLWIQTQILSVCTYVKCGCESALILRVRRGVEEPRISLGAGLVKTKSIFPHNFQNNNNYHQWPYTTLPLTLFAVKTILTYCNGQVFSSLFRVREMVHKDIKKTIPPYQQCPLHWMVMQINYFALEIHCKRKLQSRIGKKKWFPQLRKSE